MVNIALCVFLFFSSTIGQEISDDIMISHFMYPDITGIPILLDESGENTFVLNIYYPTMMKDYKIGNVLVDGSLHLPKGSYVFPSMLPKGIAPDSIKNYSQIHYIKGDYNSGELGLALEVEGRDSSYYSIQGFRKSPPVLYTASSWEDELQNYIISYERFSQDKSISVDVMYHLENHHLPLLIEEEFKRNVESFHGAINFNKKWDKFSIEFHPAFQFSNTNNQELPISYFTLWNNLTSKFLMGDNFNISLEQNSKVLMVEHDSQLYEIERHILRPRVQYNLNGIILEGGLAIYDNLYSPEAQVSWIYNHYYLSVSQHFYSYFDPIQVANYNKRNYLLTSADIGYIGEKYNIELEIFEVASMDSKHPGFREKISLDYSWMRLSQVAGLYNFGNRNFGPVNMFNYLSLLLSPPSYVWPWKTNRFQPFMGFESYYIQHSKNASIMPNEFPIFSDQRLGILDSHLMNIEVGILVSRFKISYRWFNVLQESIQNSNITRSLQPMNQLVVEWQFWD